MRLLFMMAFVFLVACQQGDETVRKVDMYNAGGDMIGTATLAEQPDGVKVKLKLEGLKPGFHGIHVHEYPKCEGPDFKSAGNHLDPEGKEHGLMHPDGAHLGDLPNIKADADGLVDAELMLANATFKDGKKSILKGEGTSLIITEDMDDGVSQPGGDSGPRIACGEMKTNPKPTGSKETPTNPTENNEKQKEK